MTSDVSSSNEYTRGLGGLHLGNIAQTAEVHRSALKCGISGQTSADRPAFAGWLVGPHVDSISLTSHSVLCVLERFSKETVVHHNPGEPAPLREQEQFT